MCPIKTLDYYFGAFAGNYVLFCVFLRKKKICVILCFFFLFRIPNHLKVFHVFLC